GAALVAAADDGGFFLAVEEAEFVRLQPPDLVAQTAGFLALEVGGGGAHAFFEVFAVGAQVVADEVVARFVAGLDQHAVAAGGVGNDVGDLALDRGWRDAVLFVVGLLLLAAALGLRHRAFHRSRDAVGIEDDLGIDVARGAADGLDQRSLRAEEAFLVGIEDADETALGDVE